jgi:uncharacterized protein (DUF58 family)
MSLAPQSLRSPEQSRISGRPRIPKILGRQIPAVWLRFLIALLGLVLAFAAALFSTVSQESGNLWTTVILASVALLLATVVGLTTVPYLARRVATARIRNAFEYDVTRVGIIYIVVIVVVAIAALNTGNNLLYIVVAALLAAILVSGVASALVLGDLELDVRLPNHVFAGRPVPARIILRNPRRWLPSFSISVVSLNREKSAKRWRWTATTFSFPPGRPPHRQWLKLPDRQLRRVAESAPQSGIFQGSTYFPHIPPLQEVTANLELNFERRGRYQQEGFGLCTRFPFAFLAKTRRLPLAREIVVYPAVTPTDRFFEILPLITGELETFTRGRGSDLYLIREYTQEDSARHVDWKATAKSGSLKVREFSREDERKLRIVFDNPEPGAVAAPAYEDAVSLAASLAWHFAGEGTEISFAAPGYEGAPDIYKFLTYLAVVQPEKAQPKKAASAIDELPASADYNIIFTARPRGTIPTALWARSYFIFIGRRPNAN